MMIKINKPNSKDKLIKNILTVAITSAILNTYANSSSFNQCLVAGNEINCSLLREPNYTYKIKNLGKLVSTSFTATGETTYNYGVIEVSKKFNVDTGFNNYGLVKFKVNGDAEIPTISNHGIIFIEKTVATEDNSSEIVQEYKIGDGGIVSLPDGTQMEVINGVEGLSQSTFIGPHILVSTKDNNFDHKILNASSLIFDNQSPTTIENSIINAILDFNGKVAEGSKELTIHNSIFNGSQTGRKYNISVQGSGNLNLNFTGKTIINGFLNIYWNNELPADPDAQHVINISNSVILNGSILGHLSHSADTTPKNITLNITNSGNSADNFKLSNEIRNITNFNIQANTTLTSTSKLVDVTNINIGADADLTLQIDMDKRGSNGEIIGNAFYGNQGTIQSLGGKLIIDAFPTNPFSKGEIIDFGGTKLDNNLWGVDADGSLTGRTDSKVVAKHGLINADMWLDPQGNNKIIVSAKEDLPEPPPTVVPPNTEAPQEKPQTNQNAYEDIYDAIKNAGKFEDLKLTSDNQQIYWTMEQLYSANPYGYTMKSALNSLKLFKDTNYSTVMPIANQNLLSVRAIYTGDITDNYASGYGHYSERNLKTQSNSVGAMLTNEYGINDNSSLGLVFGYNKQTTTFKSLSQIKSDNFYGGIFLKNNFENFKTKISLGYQYSLAKVEHNIVNTQDSFANNADLTNHSVSVSMEGKYDFHITKSLTIAPVLSTSAYYIQQSCADEGNGRLASLVKSSFINLVDVGAGLDFGYQINFASGALKQVLHLGAIGTFGDNEKMLNASFIPAENNQTNSYSIKAFTIPKVMGKVGYKLEFEASHNFVYSFSGNYEIGKNLQNFNAQLGIGYKF